MDALFPTLIVFLSLVGLFLIFLGKSKEKEEKIKEGKEGKGINILNWFKKFQRIPLRDIFLNFWEKFLRRIRIIVLRIDRIVSEKLKQVSKGKFLKEKEKKDLKPISQSETEKDYLETQTFEELNNISFKDLDLKEEEIKLLKEINKNLENFETLKNLARLYLWEKDYHSASWALLQVYYKKADDRVIYDLFFEIKESREKEKGEKEKGEKENSEMR